MRLNLLNKARRDRDKTRVRFSHKTEMRPRVSGCLVSRPRRDRESCYSVTFTKHSIGYKSHLTFFYMHLLFFKFLNVYLFSVLNSCNVPRDSKNKRMELGSQPIQIIYNNKCSSYLSVILQWSPSHVSVVSQSSWSHLRVKGWIV